MLAINQFFFSLITQQFNVSDKVITELKRLGIINIRDLLFYRPTSYQMKIISPNLSQLQNGQIIQTQIIIRDILQPKNSNRPLKILVSNETGSINLVFFNHPPNFILSKLRIGSKYLITGKIQIFADSAQIAHPEFIWDNKFLNPIEPIYPLTYGLVNRQLYGYIIKAINLLEREYDNILETTSELKSYIESLLTDLKTLHLYQVTTKELPKTHHDCLRKLAAKELFANQLLLQNIRLQTQRRIGNSFSKASILQKSIIKALGFELTNDQKKVIEEIERDQLAPVEMMRLLQGDVGSGKTLVALLTMINVASNKSQAALMAPTDLLANQHYQFFAKALEASNIRLGLLTGKISTKERSKLLLSLENGEIDILIGTHALFQQKVNFKNLAYIVIDEQHKFGVQQRLELINKASAPDVLIMTATPIPRSLTLTMFGDMAISKLIDMPQNRLPIITTVMPKTKLTDIINVLSKKLTSAEKIYWICPVIEQNNQGLDQELATQKENIGLIDLISRFNSVEKTYPNITAMIHGRMKSEQKEKIMQQFKNGEVQILVATTVIEVGIDVSDATLIIIENAEQFGLAQLHQIRGRVGRGNIQAHCILLYDHTKLSPIAKARLEVMRTSNDGFYIAEQDLLLRGSGEILGTKQSGEIRFFFTDLSRDTDLLIKANKLVAENSDNNSSLFTFQTELFAKIELSELN
jgi:ATP-dependent DNA helicase RecG